MRLRKREVENILTGNYLKYKGIFGCKLLHFKVVVPVYFTTHHTLIQEQGILKIKSEGVRNLRSGVNKRKSREVEVKFMLL